MDNEKLKIPFDIIVIDLETNALSIPDVRITEIGAVRLNPNLDICDSFSHLVYADVITPKSVEITGITAEMIKGQPPFEEVGRRFHAWTQEKPTDFVLAAWGAYYDLPVLRHEYNRVGMNYPFPGRGIDVKSVAWTHFWKKGLDLKSCSIARALKCMDMEFEGTAHRALADALMAARVFRVAMGINSKGGKKD